MSEPDISTLARRLAEQNNVDWRALSGSGPDGKVVERDVLDFLARVMAGDEATNPTPEPLPDGMESWPDQNLHEVRAGVGEAASLGDLRQELADSVRPEEPAAAPGGRLVSQPYGAVESVPFGDAKGAAAGQVDPVDVDEDIFLFDEGQAGQRPEAADGASAAAGGFAEPGTTASRETMAAGDDLDDLLVAGDEFDDGEGTTAFGHDDGSATVGGTGHGDDLGAAAAGADAYGDGAETGQHDAGAETFGHLTAGSFDEASDELGEEPDDDRHGAVSGAVDGASEGDAVWSQPLSGEASSDLEGTDDSSSAGWTEGAPGQSTTTSSDWGSSIALGKGAHDGSVGETAGESAGEADLWGEPPATDHDTGDLWATGDEAVAEPLEASGPGTGEAQVDPWLGPSSTTDFASSAEHADVADETGFGFAPAAAEESEEGAPAEQAAPREEAAPGPDFAAEPGAAPDTVLGRAGAPLDAAELPLARSATILRRHIDVSALAASQLSVGNELGFDEPLGVAPFLLRAVARAAVEIGVTGDHVAMAVLERGLELRRVGDAAGRSFASLVAELSEAAVIEDEPRLVAADLSGLDLDEVVLDLDVPVVTLGRILYDNQRGAYRSTLALSGATQPEAGARLLARVAELLDAPVRLVL